jgi:hypothetical protein
MKKLLFVCAALLITFATGVSARAADITGAWTASMQTPDGNSMDLSFTFKQDGAVLTGSLEGPQGGDPIVITDGKIDGDKISFKISFNGMTIIHEGVVSADGDEIKLSTKSDSGDFPANEMTLKRVKPAPVPAAASSSQP